MSGYAALTRPTGGGVQGGKLTHHFANVGSHFAKLTHHFANVGPHFAKLTHHFANVSPHFAKLTHHFANVSSHFAKLTRYFANVSSHFAKLAPHIGNRSLHFASSVGRVSPKGVTRRMAPVLSVAGEASGYAALTRAASGCVQIATSPLHLANEAAKVSLAPMKTTTRLARALA